MTDAPRRLQVGDWIHVSWMQGAKPQPILAFDDDGDPIVEHPVCGGLFPITVDVFDFVCSADSPALFVGAGL